MSWLASVGVVVKIKNYKKTKIWVVDADAQEIQVDAKEIAEQ